MKLKVHSELELLRGAIDAKLYFGNMLADAGAGAAARRHSNSLKQSEVEKWDAIGFLIAKRLAQI